MHFAVDATADPLADAIDAAGGKAHARFLLALLSVGKPATLGNLSAVLRLWQPGG